MQKADTAAHRQDQIRPYYPSMGGVGKPTMQTHPCVKVLDRSHTPQVTALLTGGLYAPQPTQREQAARQKVTAKSGAWGGSLVAHINIRASPTPAALRVLD